MRATSLSCILAATAASASNFAGPDQFICGTATALQADALGAGETGFWTVVQGTADFLQPASPNSAVINLGFGENVLRWTIFTSAGQASDLVTIWCYSNTMPVADAGPDQSVGHWPGTAQLNGSAPIAPGTCFWSVLSGNAAFSSPTDPQATVSGLGIGVNVLQWNCDNGPCGSSSDQVVIDAVVGIEETAADPPISFDQRERLIRSTHAVNVQVLDGRGRLAATGMTGPSRPMRLSHLQPGLYLVLASAGSSAHALRIVLD